MTITSNQTDASFHVASQANVAAQVSSVLAQRQPWWPSVSYEIRQMVETYPVDMHALNRSLTWLVNLPRSMPRPEIGFGEDGSVSVEWDRRGNVLHARFERECAEIYFCGANGDEFETSLDAGEDKIRSAVVSIVVS